VDYKDFLASKQQAIKHTGFDVDIKDLNPNLFPFQAHIVQWALKIGKAAVFTGCGMGKSLKSLSWASAIINRHPASKILVLAPLSVGVQTVSEGAKFGITARFTKSGEVLADDSIVITNYENLHKFDANEFIGVVIDESSVLKHYSSSMRNQIIETFAKTQYKLACTATPSPNDYMELGNHAEFLGVMNRTEMLATYFVHDGGDTSKWRLKGHAEDDFWKWITTWAIMIKKPSDLGYDDTGYILPGIEYHLTTVASTAELKPGQLFDFDSKSLMERRQARRSSLDNRVEKCAEIVASRPDEQFIIWCDLNDEGDRLEKLVPKSTQVAGRHTDEQKDASIAGFINGDYQVMISKASILGFGMNLQFCSNVIFAGLSDSYESFYQAVRRCYRFGQVRDVDVFIVTSAIEQDVLKNIQRKQGDAENMAKKIVSNLMDAQGVRSDHSIESTPAAINSSSNRYEVFNGDCVEHARSLADDSIDYSIYSPPFSSLYTYSNSEKDMGNSRNDEEFYKHYQFLVAELYRVLRPGRLLSFHCMNLPRSKQHDGVIGIKDFRGELIRLHEAAGFIFHSEVVIWKDPVIAMQRTKALGLLHKQLKKDSAMSRQGIPDYLVTMRKPGVNEQPIAGHLTYYAGEDPDGLPTENGDVDDRTSINIWQRYASPIWMDINPSRTLQKDSAREERDERHICPLQIDVIERAVQLWTNPSDLVYSPFTGIGSEGYVSLKMGRRFVGAELKRSYYVQAIANLKSVCDQGNQQTLGIF
jgi:DNA modification methylase